MWNLNYDTNKHIYETENRPTDTENRLVVATGEGKDKLEEFGMNRYTLLRIKQINNKDLLYSTGNYTQYPALTYNGKRRSKKEYTERDFPGGSVVKNPPVTQETTVLSLGQEDPLEKGKSYPLQYSGLENQSMGVAKSRTGLSNFHFLEKGRGTYHSECNHDYLELNSKIL